MLRHLHSTSLSYLLSTFNLIWHSNTYPETWKKATILAFLKSNKPKTDPESFKPIALTSCFEKLMEKMINIRLINYIEANSLFSSFQYGFRRMRSAPDSLIRLASDIPETFAAREELVCIFFDMKKAYDITRRYGIIKAVHTQFISSILE